MGNRFHQSIKSVAACWLVLFVAMFVSVPDSALAQDGAPLPDIPYILVDANTNTVIKASRPFERWHPASLTKLMTAYTTFKAIERGEISAGSPVTITANATKRPPSKMGYKAGTKLRFDTALRILIVKSANDVATALAESLAGTVPAFIGRMNREAERLGLRDTRFENANGLHNKNQYTSARDMVVLSAAIWNEFPQYREMFETPTIQAGKRKYTSYNLLLERFAGTTGMKTGFVCASGYNIVASAERNGRRLVAVVMGASSQTERAEIAARLFLLGFQNKTGTPMNSLQRPQNVLGPTNMRPQMCTEAARANRYDPASETAVLNSPWLEKRKVTKTPVKIVLGNIDGDPSDAWLARAFMPKRIPVPTKRPDYVVVNVDGDVISTSTLRGTIPLPTWRPQNGSTTN